MDICTVFVQRHNPLCDNCLAGCWSHVPDDLRWNVDWSMLVAWV